MRLKIGGYPWHLVDEDTGIIVAECFMLDREEKALAIRDAVNRVDELEAENARLREELARYAPVRRGCK